VAGRFEEGEWMGGCIDGIDGIGYVVSGRSCIVLLLSSQIWWRSVGHWYEMGPFKEERLC
jgi:hypothetical protein